MSHFELEWSLNVEFFELKKFHSGTQLNFFESSCEKDQFLIFFFGRERERKFRFFFLQNHRIKNEKTSGRLFENPKNSKPCSKYKRLTKFFSAKNLKKNFQEAEDEIFSLIFIIFNNSWPECFHK